MSPIDRDEFDALLRRVDALQLELAQLRDQVRDLERGRGEETGESLTGSGVEEAIAGDEAFVGETPSSGEIPSSNEMPPSGEKSILSGLVVGSDAEGVDADLSEVTGRAKRPELSKDLLDFMRKKRAKKSAGDEGKDSEAEAVKGTEEVGAKDAGAGATGVAKDEEQSGMRGKFRLPAGLSFLQPIVDWFSPPPGERFSVEEALIRVFTVVAMIAAMFSAAYFSAWIQSRVPNIVKVGLMYLAAGGLLAGGWRLRASMARLSRPMLAGGLALAYFTSYAGHFIPATQAFGVWVSLALMTATLLGLVMLAERLRSEMLAIFTVFLGYVTAYISGSSYFALLMNGSLALTAMLFLWRNRWVNVAAISVLGTYGFHLFWMLFWDHAPVSAAHAFWMNAGMLIGYFLIHQAGAMFSEIHREELQRLEYKRLLYMAWNAVIFWSMMMLTFFMTKVYREQTEWLHFGYSAALFGLGFYYHKRHALLTRVYFGLSITLFTLGLIVALAGDARYLALTAEGVLLLIAARHLGIVSLRRGALFVAFTAFLILIGTLMNQGGELDGNWREPIFFRALFCSLVWFAAAAWYPGLLRRMERISVEEGGGRPFFGGWVLGGLGALSWLLLQAICLNSVWLFWLPLTVLVLTIAADWLKHSAFRFFAIFFAAIYLVVGVVELRSDMPDSLKVSMLGILICAGAGFYPELRRRVVGGTAAGWARGSLSILPLMIAHLLFVELVIFHAPSEWVLPLMWVALVVAVAPVYALKTARIFCVSLIPFIALSLRLFWELWIERQLFVASRGFVFQHSISLVLLAVLPIVISRIGEWLSKIDSGFVNRGWVHLFLFSPAVLVPLACLQYFEPGGAIVALALVAILAFAPAGIFGLRQYAFVGVGWLFLAHLTLHFHAFKQSGWSPTAYSLLLLLLAALTIVQERIMTLGFSKLRSDNWAGDGRGAMLGISTEAPRGVTSKKFRENLQVYFGGLFFLLAIHGLWNHPAFYPQLVTVAWTFCGLAFFVLGFLLRVKFYPRVAFAILIAAIARAFLVDTQQLTELTYRIVAFLVLALILLGVCFAFLKTKDQFEKWN